MYRTPVRESGRRIALVVLLLTAAGGASATGAQADPAGTTHYPDLQTVIPTTRSRSCRAPPAASSATRTSSSTPARAAGDPAAVQRAPPATTRACSSSTRTTRPTSGRWSASVRVPDAFIFHAAHGHFHFPLAAFGLYAVAADGGHRRAGRRSRPRTASASTTPTSTTRTVVHAGTFIGTQGSCADPTALRGLTRRRGRRVRLPRPGPGDPVRRRRPTAPTGSGRSPTPTTTSPRPTRPTTRPT